MTPTEASASEMCVSTNSAPNHHVSCPMVISKSSQHEVERDFCVESIARQASDEIRGLLGHFFPFCMPGLGGYWPSSLLSHMYVTLNLGTCSLEPPFRQICIAKSCGLLQNVKQKIIFRHASVSSIYPCMSVCL